MERKKRVTRARSPNLRTKRRAEKRQQKKSISFTVEQNHQILDALEPGERDDDEWSVSEMDPVQAQEERFAQLRGQVVTGEDEEEGGDTSEVPPPLPPFPSELRRIHSCYTPRRPPSPAEDDDSHSESSCAPLDLCDDRSQSDPVKPYGRTLVLAGNSSYSLMHHLGVVLFYIETQQLRYVTHIVAEDYGVCLAVLLKAHWDKLLGFTSAEQAQELLMVPCLELLLRNPVDDYASVMQRHFNFLCGGSPLLWWEPSVVPELTLFHKVPHKDVFAAERDGLPVSLYWRESELVGKPVCETLKCLFLEALNAADNPLANSLSHSHNLWSHTYGILVTDSQFHGKTGRVYISYAGDSMFPPIDEKSLNEVVAEVRTPYDFCAVAWKGSQLGVAVDVTLYSVFGGEYKHVVNRTLKRGRGPRGDLPTLYKQQISAYYLGALVERARNVALLQNMMNWGFIVAWSTDTLLSRHTTQYGEQLPQVDRQQRLALPEQYQPLEDQVSLVSLAPDPTKSEPTHTPCKWLVELFSKRKK